MAQASLTARRICQAGAKAEHSEPRVYIRCSSRLTDKSYPGDNRLVLPKSSYRRQCSAPRCRLNLSWGWRRSQGFGCSPIKKLRELGSDRLEVKILTFKPSESSHNRQISGFFVYEIKISQPSRRLLLEIIDVQLTNIGKIPKFWGQYRGKSAKMPVETRR